MIGEQLIWHAAQSADRIGFSATHNSPDQPIRASWHPWHLHFINGNEKCTDLTLVACCHEPARVPRLIRQIRSLKQNKRQSLPAHDKVISELKTCCEGLNKVSTISMWCREMRPQPSFYLRWLSGGSSLSCLCEQSKWKSFSPPSKTFKKRNSNPDNEHSPKVCNTGYSESCRHFRELIVNISEYH